VIWGVRIVLAGALFAVAASKVVPLVHDVHAVHRAAEAVPQWMLLVAAFVELAASLMLLSRWWAWGARVSFALGCLFSVMVAYLVLSGLPVQACGCVGNLELSVGTHYALVVGLLLCARFLVISGTEVGERAVVDVGHGV
jgi:hypothetical protein